MKSWVIITGLIFFGCTQSPSSADSSSSSDSKDKSSSSANNLSSSSIYEISSSSAVSQLLLIDSNIYFEPNTSTGIQILLSGDTLTIYDHFALSEEPPLYIDVLASQDTMNVWYKSTIDDGGIGSINDWAPTVKVELKFLVNGVQRTTFFFHGLSYARAPSDAETGFRNALRDTIVEFSK